MVWSHGLARSGDKHHYICTTRVHMATKLGGMISYLVGLLHIKSYDPLMTGPCEITWQTKTIISPIPQSMATKLRRMVSYLNWLQAIKLLDPLITWSCQIKSQTKTIISQLLQCENHQTRQLGDLHWGAPVVIVTWTFDRVVLLDPITN